MTKAWTSIARFFRSPKVILSELAGMALVCAAGAALGMDRLFHSAWFLALTTATALSLAIVVKEQCSRMIRLWSKQSPAGLIGSPIFHFGLLLIIGAGIGRALFGSEAVVDLVEGETLAATPSAWTRQYPGIFGKTFRLSHPVTLNAIRATRYEDGDLRELTAALTLQTPSGNHDTDLAINRDVKTPAGRLFLGSDFGPAALLEWQKAGTPPCREAVLMADCGQGVYEGSSSGSNGLKAHVRAFVGRTVKHPDQIELRIMRGAALLFTGDPRVGQTVTLQSGESVSLRGTPFWAKLRGSRDPALWLAYSGFSLLLTGAVLIVGSGRLDPRRAACA